MENNNKALSEHRFEEIAANLAGKIALSFPRGVEYLWKRFIRTSNGLHSEVTYRDLSTGEKFTVDVSEREDVIFARCYDKTNRLHKNCSADFGGNLTDVTNFFTTSNSVQETEIKDPKQFQFLWEEFAKHQSGQEYKLRTSIDDVFSESGYTLSKFDDHIEISKRENGVLHNLFGPAIVFSDGKWPSYYINGSICRKEQFDKRVVKIMFDNGLADAIPKPSEQTRSTSQSSINYLFDGRPFVGIENIFDLEFSGGFEKEVSKIVRMGTPGQFSIILKEPQSFLTNVGRFNDETNRIDFYYDSEVGSLEAIEFVKEDENGENYTTTASFSFYRGEATLCFYNDSEQLSNHKGPAKIRYKSSSATGEKGLCHPATIESKEYFIDGKPYSEREFSKHIINSGKQEEKNQMAIKKEVLNEVVSSAESNVLKEAADRRANVSEELQNTIKRVEEYMKAFSTYSSGSLGSTVAATANTPYKIYGYTDFTSPSNFYGITKAKIEEQIKAAGGQILGPVTASVPPVSDEYYWFSSHNQQTGGSFLTTKENKAPYNTSNPAGPAQFEFDKNGNLINFSYWYRGVRFNSYQEIEMELFKESLDKMVTRHQLAENSALRKLVNDFIQEYGYKVSDFGFLEPSTIEEGKAYFIKTSFNPSQSDFFASAPHKNLENFLRAANFKTDAKTENKRSAKKIVSETAKTEAREAAKRAAVKKIRKMIVSAIVSLLTSDLEEGKEKTQAMKFLASSLSTGYGSGMFSALLGMAVPVVTSRLPEEYLPYVDEVAAELRIGGTEDVMTDLIDQFEPIVSGIFSGIKSSIDEVKKIDEKVTELTPISKTRIHLEDAAIVVNAEERQQEQGAEEEQRTKEELKLGMR